MEKMTLDEINALISDKKFEEAQKALKKLLQKDERNIEAIKLSGLCNVNLEKFDDGRKDFETVVKYKPDDASSWFYLANCYDNMEDFLHAKSAYQEVIRLRENYVDAYKNLCVVYVKSGEAEKAIEFGKKALEFVQDDYAVYYIIGTACMSLKKYEESIEFLEKALELNPNHSQLYNNLGTSYVTMGNLEKAYENFKKASELEPDNSITYYNIGSILQIKEKHKEAIEYFQKAYDIEPQESYIIAMALSEFKGGMLEDAIKHYKKLATAHPEKPNFQYNLACAYEQTGELHYAIGILTRLVTLNPKSVNMSLKLANLYLKVNQPLHAKEIYEKLVRQGSVSQEIYYDYAHICVLTNDMDKAEKILKKVIELNPEFAPAHKDLGVIYLGRRLFDYAKDEFETALKCEPENPDMMFEYANYLHATSSFKESDEYYQKVLEKQPDNYKAMAFSALNKIQFKDFDKALEEINTAMAHLPQDPFLLYIAGRIRFLRGEYEDAKIFLVKSYEMEPDSDTKNLLALCYYELEDYKQAVTIFRSILDKSPMNVNVLVSCAKCYEKLGDIEMALQHLEKAVEIFPECEEAHEMIRALS